MYRSPRHLNPLYRSFYSNNGESETVKFEKTNLNHTTSQFNRSPQLSTNVSITKNNARENLSPRFSPGNLGRGKDCSRYSYFQTHHSEQEKINVQTNYDPNSISNFASTSRSKMNINSNLVNNAYTPGRIHKDNTMDNLNNLNNVKNPFAETQQSLKQSSYSNCTFSQKLSPRYNKSIESVTNDLPLKREQNEHISSSRKFSPIKPTRLGEKMPSSITLQKPSVDSYSLKFLSLEEEAFQDFLREIINLGSEIELAKSDLALRPDFNLSNSFRIFESNKLENISDLDLKYGLNFLDLFPIMDEVLLVFNQFKTRGQKFLS